MAKGTLGCGLTMVKNFIFAINLLFFFVGIGLIAAGSYVAATLSDFKGAFTDGFGFAVAIPVITITLGVFVLIGSAMGFIGAIKENTCMIKTFAGFLIVFMLVELGIAGTIIAYNTNDDIQNKIEGFMQENIEGCANKNGATTVSAECKFLVPIQDLVGCCGFNSSKSQPVRADWEKQCIADGPLKLKLVQENSQGFCNNRILDFISSNLVIVAGVLGGIFFAEILLLVLTCLLINGIKSDNKYA